ncbi:MAG: hypothetical protein LBJ69_01590 [Holosporales bacterium]|jgi:hypothetical protein|nr:hypothetical protein [Holosporales bacterium]
MIMRVMIGAVLAIWCCCVADSAMPSGSSQWNYRETDVFRILLEMAEPARAGTNVPAYKTGRQAMVMLNIPFTYIHGCSESEMMVHALQGHEGELGTLQRTHKARRISTKNGQDYDIEFVPRNTPDVQTAPPPAVEPTFPCLEDLLRKPPETVQTAPPPVRTRTFPAHSLYKSRHRQASREPETPQQSMIRLQLEMMKADDGLLPELEEWQTSGMPPREPSLGQALRKSTRGRDDEYSEEDGDEE